jgi:hypothetical protein
VRARDRLPVAEGEESDSFHSGFSAGCCLDIPSTLAHFFDTGPFIFAGGVVYASDP